MLFIAAGSCKLEDAVSSILIEWTPITLPTSNGPGVVRRSFETTKAAGDRFVRNHEARFS
jgi:hypothetical protein